MRPARKIGTKRVHAFAGAGSPLCGVRVALNREMWVYMRDGTDVTCPRCLGALDVLTEYGYPVRPTRSEQSLEGAAVNGLTPVGQEAASE